MRRTWAARLFDGPVPVVEIAVLIMFALVSVCEVHVISAALFAVFVLILVFAMFERRVVDMALLAGTYFVFRFHLIETAPTFRYISDLITVLDAVGVVSLLVTRSGRLRWYDGLFVAWGAYALGLAFLRDVPLIPAIVQIRALVGVYPLFVLVREIGFEKAAARRGAALAYYEFFAWALFLQAFLEKLSGKVLFMTPFVRWTPISHTNWPRVYGWTANPNSLGALCVLLIALGLLLAAWGYRGNWLDTGFALCFGTLILSVSRSAMWGLIVFLIVVLSRKVFERISRRDALRLLVRPFAVGLFCAVVAILLSIAIPKMTAAFGSRDTGGFGIFGRFVTGDDEVQSSMAGGRLFSLTTGIEIATRGADDLLLGQGPGTYGSAGANFWDSPLYEEYDIPEYFYADMFGIMMLVEVGLVGILLFGAGLVGLTWSNSAMPGAWRLGIGALLGIWSLFYNVPEITMLYFPILVFLGVPMPRPREEDAPTWSAEVWSDKEISPVREARDETLCSYE